MFGLDLHGLLVPVADLERSILHLLGFLATDLLAGPISKSGSKLSPETAIPDHLLDLHLKLRNHAFTRELVSVAALLRLADDRCQRQLLSRNLPGFVFHMPKSRQQKITLRDACDKILHADHAMRRDQRQRDSLDMPRGLHRVYADEFQCELIDMIGKKKDGTSWSVTIDLLHFLNFAAQAVSEYKKREDQARLEREREIRLLIEERSSQLFPGLPRGGESEHNKK